MRNNRPNPYANLTHEDWWHPDDLSKADAPILTDTQVNRFIHDGFLPVTGLWPVELVKQVVREVTELHPREKVIGRKGAFSEMPWTHAGEASPDLALNQMTIHPRVLSAVAQLLAVTPGDLRLSQSHVIARYGHVIRRPGDERDGTIFGDQDIHVDYGNNTLMVPPRGRPEAVACLCYYSDVTESGGATHFVKAEPGELTTYTPEDFNPPNFITGTHNGSAREKRGVRSEEKTEKRYQEEKPIFYTPGTCILYRLDAWHRGTPAAARQVRYSHHHVWRRKDAEWVNWQSLALPMSQMPTRYLSNLSVEQRCVLGFAAPGDPYWNRDTIDAVGQRYPEMDMTPYKTS